MRLPQYNMTNRVMDNFEMGGIDRSCAAAQEQLYESENLDPQSYPHFSGILEDAEPVALSGQVVGVLDPMEEEIEGFCGAVKDSSDSKIYFYWDGEKAEDENGTQIILTDELLDGEKRFARVGQVISVMPDKTLITLTKIGMKTQDPETELFSLGSFSFVSEKQEYVEGSATDSIYTVTLKRAWTGSTALFDELIGKLNAIIGQKIRLEGYTKRYDEITASDQAYYWLLTGAYDGSSTQNQINITLQAFNIFSENISGEGALEDGGYNTSTKPSTITVRKLNPQICYGAGMGSRIFGLDDTGNMIACTADGDLKQWERYEGISSDSWASPVGTTGAWTGCAVVGNSFLAFKKSALHVVQGNYATNYQITKNLNTGCIDSHSIAVIDDTVYYLSSVGFCTYYYGQVEEISSPLARRYVSAKAGVKDGRYHVVATDEEGSSEYLIYDPRLRIWLREGERSFLWFYTMGMRLMAVTGAGVQELECTGGKKAWSIQTQRINDRAFVRRGINVVRVIAEFEEGSDYIDVYVTTEQGRQHCGRVSAAKKEGVPVRFYATVFYTLELEGSGGAHLIGMQRQLRSGGEFR